MFRFFTVVKLTNSHSVLDPHIHSLYPKDVLPLIGSSALDQINCSLATGYISVLLGGHN